MEFNGIAPATENAPAGMQVFRVKIIGCCRII